ncbi:hypothetical protein SAMN05444000_12334 [Shimia gijangensis]|uniref:Tellurium resistance protein n=1 Tax=Shimia gijangensis TaxID=1470563 RepID=A0A1M6QVC3_9RHOB|nr:TrgA family protein [Shimia gijangensis]SHK24212.1 hypothetical protein SAMN05444000_12334 [Shimia gijangensis]
MPTGSRLVAAICLAILSAIIAEMVKPLMPEATVFGKFTYVTAFLGLIVGWTHLGARAGGSVVDGVNNGITAVALLVVFALLVFGSYEMVDQALRHRYSNLLQALRGILAIGVDYGQYLLDVEIIVTLVVGAVVSGLITEFAYRRWR